MTPAMPAARRFCQHCGAAVNGPQAFCSACGAQLSNVVSVPAPALPPPPQMRKRNPVATIFLIIGVCCGLWLVYAVVSALGTSDSGQSTQQTSTPVAPASTASTPQVQQANTPATYEIGQQFSVGYWTYRINRAFWTPFLGAFNPYSMQRANATFIVVNLIARNDDTSSSTFPPFQLTDEQGRTYDESPQGLSSDGFFSPLEELNPGVSKGGNVAFDVPPDRQYFLLISGGIESGKHALVKLPPYSPPSSPQQQQQPANPPSPAADSQ
jgi:hypothetical protein